MLYYQDDCPYGEIATKQVVSELTGTKCANLLLSTPPVTKILVRRILEAVFMKKSKRHSMRVIGSCGAFCLVAASVSAQDALRASLAGEQLAEQRKKEFENQRYNLRLGDFKMSVSASQGFEYNDNVNYTSLQPQTDFILRPMLNLSAMQPIGQANLLKFNIGLGYEKYLDNSQYDTVVIEPGSSLNFDVFVKDFKINFHDNFSYQNDPGREASIARTGKYGGLDNALGTTVTWDLEDLVFNVGYDYSKFIAEDNRYEYLNRDSHNFLARAGLKVHPTVTTGLEASAGPTYYDIPLLNDNFATSIGAYADWMPTEYIRIQPRAGYAQYEFTENAFFGKLPTEGSTYFGLNFNHRLNRIVSYTVDGGQGLRMGVGANLLKEWKASGNVNLRLIEKLTLSSGVTYTTGSEKGSLTVGNNQEYDRIYASIGGTYQILEKLSASLRYNHYLRTSNYQYWDYTQNRITLNLTYRF